MRPSRMRLSAAGEQQQAQPRMYAARRISRSLCGMAATNGWSLRLAFGSSGVRVDSKADDVTHDMRYYSTYATPYSEENFVTVFSK